MARKFLYIIAVLIGLVIAAAFAYRLFGLQLMQMAMVPSATFEKPKGDNAYDSAQLWIARPDIAGNPSLWLPPGVDAAPAGKAAIFFIHPTSYLSRATWNAPLDDKDGNERAALFVRGQASVFTGAGEVWAPRYRQATFGAFLTGQKEAQLALDSAYLDVQAAFDAFVASIDPKRPIILAGHSQGALHLTRLLKDRIAGKPIAKRIVAAYAIGWPVSVTADLPAMRPAQNVSASAPRGESSPKPVMTVRRVMVSSRLRLRRTALWKSRGTVSRAVLAGSMFNRACVPSSSSRADA